MSINFNNQHNYSELHIFYICKHCSSVITLVADVYKPLIIFTQKHLNKSRWIVRLKSRFRNTEHEVKSKSLGFKMWGCSSLGLKPPSTVVNRMYVRKPMTVYVLPVKYRLDELTPLLHETEQVIQEFLPLGIVIYLVQLKQTKQHCC